MKRSDLILILSLVVLIAPFFIFEPVYDGFIAMTKEHGYLMAFLKFAILATLGEMIGLRIKSGVYNYQGFGLMPRAVVWGFLGVWIAVAMNVFAVGSPAMVESAGISGVVESMKGAFCAEKLLGAFAISVMMNTTFAPVFMTIHKITDTHILAYGGSMKCFLHPIPMKTTIANLNWGVQWSFVFKKTLPLFWIPAHTITFLLPAVFQVLFAASLSIVLGVFLSVAAILSRKENSK